MRIYAVHFVSRLLFFLLILLLSNFIVPINNTRLMHFIYSLSRTRNPRLYNVLPFCLQFIYIIKKGYIIGNAVHEMRILANKPSLEKWIRNYLRKRKVIIKYYEFYII